MPVLPGESADSGLFGLWSCLNDIPHEVVRKRYGRDDGRDYVYVDRDFLASQEPEAVALREKMFGRGEKL